MDVPRLVLVDRDGVINVDSALHVKSVAEWKPLPGSLGAIAALTQAGFDVIVVTNQSGIGKRLFSEETLAEIHARMEADVAAAGGRIAAIYYCPHRPDEGCLCRKPRPGLLQRIATDFGTDLEGVPFIGDKDSDARAALAVGARPILVRSGLHIPAQRLCDRPVEVYTDLAEAAAKLIAEGTP